MSHLDFSHVPAAEFQELLRLTLGQCPSAVINSIGSRASYALGFPPSYADSIVWDKTDDGLHAIQLRITGHIAAALGYLRGRITSIYPQASVGSGVCIMPHSLTWRIPDATSKLLIEMNVDLEKLSGAIVDTALLQKHLVARQARVEDGLSHFKRFVQSMENL